MKSAVLSALILAFSVITPAQADPLEDFLNNSTFIVAGKCLSVGAVNILLRAAVEIEVVHVIKGEKLVGKMTVDAPFGMIPGDYYLLRSTAPVDTARRRVRLDGRTSVIKISSNDEAAGLARYEPRIAVLRTFNIRASDLEAKIRSLTYEYDEIKKTTKGN